MRTAANNNANTTTTNHNGENWQYPKYEGGNPVRIGSYVVPTSHDGENWPYHLYEGSNPSLIGSYVPCATNPCNLHGGSDVYATSSEDAYTKAHQNDTLGLTVSYYYDSNEYKSDTANDESVVNDEYESMPSNNESFADNQENQINGYISNRAKKVAKEQGLYIDGSPLLHRDNDKYLDSDGSVRMHKLAFDVFPGAWLANDMIEDISDYSKTIIEDSTDEELSALKAYTGSDFGDINGTLINKKNIPEYARKKANSYINKIDSVMNRTNKIIKVITQDAIVFRKRFITKSTNDRGGEEKSFYNAVAKAMKDGSEPIITRADYMSTTWDVPEYFKSSRCSYLIKIPKGTRGLNISDESNYDESELLIDRGYKFKVVGIYEFGQLEDTTNNDYFDDNYGGDETEWVSKNADDENSHYHPVIALELIPPKDDE